VRRVGSANPLEKEHAVTAEPDFRQLFEAGPGLVLVLDPHLRILAATDAYLSAKQLRREAALGRNVFDVLPDPSDAGLRESLERVRRTGRPDSMPVFRLDIAGAEPGSLEERHWTAVNSPIFDEWRRLACIVHRVEDVTGFALLDDAGEAGDGFLQMRREILLRSEELDEANRELRSASEAKNAFLARMSHEMRSPLAAVMGFSELLSHSELDGRQRERLAMIRKASDHLLTLLNEVLDLSRIESGAISISLESVAFVPLISDTLELMRPLATKHDVRLRPVEVDNGCAQVLADNQRLRQVLIKLISNAIKYNRPGGEVLVTVTKVEDRIRITVADTGRGLSEKELERLFVPFERLDAAAAGIEGSGLGLVLTRTLAEAMGGELGVESEPGVGSRFWIELGSTEAGSALRPLEPGDPLLDVRSYGGTRSVLYVEDTLANVHLIEGILERRPGVRLLSATHGARGRELARKHSPDLILLDLHLPDVPGEELLEQFRKDQSTANVPIVVLSADANRERAPLIAAGASAFLTKPIGVRRLLEVIDRFLAGAEGEQRAEDPAGTSATP
jgi:signal transduction histidine kinase/ActR/RegA family two-component response regulator